jgi:alkanesulfonate monooxygenase SsuD/methylene tetrahydromethanopterin reductase-like flavin-dependent oxidoreductase (luciferase family)
VIRALLRGEEVSHHGRVTVDRARLWTLPDRLPAIFGAALSEETARWCGEWADGLVTVHQPPQRLRPVVEAFRDGGGGAKPVYVQVKLAWDPDESIAERQAFEQWGTNVFDSKLMADLELVEQFEVAATYVRQADVRDCVLVSSDLGRHTAWLAETLDVGVDRLYLHHVAKEQAAFIEAFGAKVLPAVGAGPRS